MKVLFIARATLYESPGGDTVQILKTAQELRNFGVLVDVHITTDKVCHDNYDIVHFFNIIRPADILWHFKRSKRTVISTIYVDYNESEKNTASFFRKMLTYLLGSFNVEYLKTIGKAILGKEKIISKDYIFLGQYRAMKYLYKNSDALLPNSYSEMSRLNKTFGNTNAICDKIVNAIDIKKDIVPNNDFIGSIICIGRIERRKNQLNLIKAANELNLPCFIIGKPALNDIGYYELCKQAANDNIKFIENLPQEKIYSIMMAAKVHVLPSWFETTGLVTLEAAYYGCNIVITDKGDQKEYFKDFAIYCNPGDVDSIKHAILKAIDMPYNYEFKKIIATDYTWKNTAEQTKAVYDKLLLN
jgi:glycosyltransferase involved in cell wall biosynthesis